VGTTQRLQIASALFISAIQSSSSSSQAALYLGFLHEFGLGTAVSNELAQEHYEKAIQCGNFSAMIRLGRLFESLGYGHKALELYHTASKHGEIEGNYRLGLCFENGFAGVKIDIKQAMKYYKRGASLNHPACLVCYKLLFNITALKYFILRLSTQDIY
jgi:uncharacterized protein